MDRVYLNNVLWFGFVIAVSPSKAPTCSLEGKHCTIGIYKVGGGVARHMWPPCRQRRYDRHGAAQAISL